MISQRVLVAEGWSSILNSLMVFEEPVDTGLFIVKRPGTPGLVTTLELWARLMVLPGSTVYSVVLLPIDSRAPVALPVDTGYLRDTLVSFLQKQGISTGMLFYVRIDWNGYIYTLLTEQASVADVDPPELLPLSMALRQFIG